ncbi:hypothetical protein ACHQM5_002768 [Ranunculus cassubicifolius]
MVSLHLLPQSTQLRISTTLSNSNLQTPPSMEDPSIVLSSPLNLPPTSPRQQRNRVPLESRGQTIETKQSQLAYGTESGPQAEHHPDRVRRRINREGAAAWENIGGVEQQGRAWQSFSRARPARAGPTA